MQCAKNMPRDVLLHLFTYCSVLFWLFWSTIDGTSHWPSCRQCSVHWLRSKLHTLSFLLQISCFRPVTGIWPRGSEFKAQCPDQVPAVRVLHAAVRTWRGQLLYTRKEKEKYESCRDDVFLKAKLASLSFPRWKAYWIHQFWFCTIAENHSVANNMFILLTHFDMTCNFKIHRLGFKPLKPVLTTDRPYFRHQT